MTIVHQLKHASSNRVVSELSMLYPEQRFVSAPTAKLAGMKKSKQQSVIVSCDALAMNSTISLSYKIVGQQYIAHGTAGCAAFENNAVYRGLVNVDIIRLSRPTLSPRSSAGTIHRRRLRDEMIV